MSCAFLIKFMSKPFLFLALMIGIFFLLLLLLSPFCALLILALRLKEKWSREEMVSYVQPLKAYFQKRHVSHFVGQNKLHG